MLGYLHFLSGGHPSQNLRPLLWNLFGGGTFHAHNMPRQQGRCKRKWFYTFAGERKVSSTDAGDSVGGVTCRVNSDSIASRTRSCLG